MRRPDDNLVLQVSVGLGLVLRAHHYLRDPSMWHDEAALVLNVLRLGFRALLGPLLHSEAGPPLFLWAERGVVILLGEGTFALRLVPFLASALALLLFAGVARRLLDPRTAALAVFLLAVSDRLLWHACEAKPYSTDVLAAVIVAWLYLRAESTPGAGTLVLAALVAPPLVFLSYPACFLLGGLLLALAPRLWRGSRSERLAYGVAAALLAAAFAVLYMGPVTAQRNPLMDRCWTDAFPDWSRPLGIPFWALAATADVADYPLRPANGLLAPVTALGLVGFARRGHLARLALLSAPVGLAFVASLLRAYPYSGTRVMVFAAPAVVVFTALGLTEVLSWAARRLEGASGLARAALLSISAGVSVLGVLPAFRAAARAAVPWPRTDAATAAAHVLARRAADEPVVGNHWEHAYYFRALGALYRDAGERAAPAERLWLVLGAAEPLERERALRAFASRRFRVAERSEFEQTTAARLIAWPP